MVFQAVNAGNPTATFARPASSYSSALIEYDAETNSSDYSWIKENPSSQWLRSDNLYIVNCPNDGNYDVYAYNTFHINVIAAWRS